MVASGLPSVQSIDGEQEEIAAIDPDLIEATAAVPDGRR